MIKASDLIGKFQYAIDNDWGYTWGSAGILWTQAKQNQKVNYMVSHYGTSWKTNSEAKSSTYYYTALYGSKWIGHYVADCSGLFAWAFRELGGSIAHGSNSIWDRYCSSKGDLSKGIRTDGKQLKNGTAVFVNPKGNDRTHIGLYIGNGTVIEAASTQKGVITSAITDKKWVEWGELKAVSYEGGDEPTPVEKPILRRGDSGPFVKLAQQDLLDKGYSLGKYGADGKFGAVTEDAVKRFQQNNGLTSDGVINSATWEALERKTPVTILYTVHIPHLTEYQADALVTQYPGAFKEEERM